MARPSHQSQPNKKGTTRRNVPRGGSPESPQPPSSGAATEHTERLETLVRELRAENARLARLAALHEQTQKTFVELVERAPFGIYVVDSQFRIATMNAGSQNGAFRNIRPIIGRPFNEAMHILWPDAVAEEIIGHFRHTLDTGEPFYSPRFVNPRHDIGIVESYEWELQRIVLPDGQHGVICYYFDSTALRDAENALRTATRRFQTIVDHAPIAIYVKDREGRFVFGNRRLEQYTGRPLEALLGKTDYDFASKHDADRWRENDLSVLEGHVSAFEETGTDQEGAPYVNLSVKFPLRNDSGTPVEVCGISTDITDRKRAEAALRESERRLREIFDSMTEAYCVIEMIFDENGRAVDFRYVETNPAFVRHATQPMLGKRIKEIVPDVEQFWLDQYGRVALTGEPAELEYVVAGLGDQWFHASAFRIGGDGSRRVGVVFENITERKRAEAERDADLSALMRMQTLSGRAVEAAGIEPLLQDTMDAAVAIVRADKGTLQLLEGDTLRIVAHHGHDRAFLDFFTAAENVASVCGEATRRGERVVVPDVEASPIFGGTSSLPVLRAAGVRAVQSTPLLTRGGHLLGMLTTQWAEPHMPNQHDLWRLDLLARQAADLIEQKTTENALRASEAKYRAASLALAEADRRKDEFIAILSHELRNPLAPIRYALPLLAEERLGAAGRRATGVIDRQVTHLSRLVDDLLDVSRITAGKIELRRDYVAIGSVVSTAVEAASPAIAAGRHSLDMCVPDAPVWLHVDAARISQAITNLLNNSAKYTPQGGRIRLEATTDEAMVTIRVIDNGIGLSSEALTTVFEMFRQASDRNTTQGGLGVGLTLAKQLVEMHGGTIEAHSEGPGHGAEFLIRLPLAAAAGPANEEQAPAASRQPACLRVLVVDDNVDLVDMLAMVVEAAGHQVRTAFDGRSAISAALEYQPNLILLDVGMPDMNGMEVAKELRRHAALGRTRIVALTGWGQAEDRRRTAEAGFDDHVTKPADPRQIQRILEEVAVGAS